MTTSHPSTPTTLMSIDEEVVEVIGGLLPGVEEIVKALNDAGYAVVRGSDVRRMMDFCQRHPDEQIRSDPATYTRLCYAIRDADPYGTPVR